MNKEWIGIGGVAKLLKRSINGARKIVIAYDIPKEAGVLGSRKIFLYSKKHCEKVASKLPKRRFSKYRSAVPRLEKRTGYMKVYVPEHPRSMCDGMVYEHWLIAEKTLGRYLAKEECVHHINRIRNDNRPENLLVYGSRGAHMQECHSHISLFLRGVYKNSKDITDQDLTEKIELLSKLTSKELDKVIQYIKRNIK